MFETTQRIPPEQNHQVDFADLAGGLAVSALLTQKGLGSLSERVRLPALRSVAQNRLFSLAAPIALVAMGLNAVKSVGRLRAHSSQDRSADILMIGGAACGIASVVLHIGKAKPLARGIIAILGLGIDLLDLSHVGIRWLANEVSTEDLLLQAGLTIAFGLDRQSRQTMSDAILQFRVRGLKPVAGASGPPPGMIEKLTLEVLDGPSSSLPPFEIRPGTDSIRIGRTDECDIRLPTDEIGEYAAMILRDEKGYHIAPFETPVSVNGILVTDERLLEDGAIIGIGGWRLQAHIEYVNQRPTTLPPIRREGPTSMMSDYDGRAGEHSRSTIPPGATPLARITRPHLSVEDAFSRLRGFYKERLAASPPEVRGFFGRGFQSITLGETVDPAAIPEDLPTFAQMLMERANSLALIFKGELDLARRRLTAISRAVAAEVEAGRMTEREAMEATTGTPYEFSYTGTETGALQETPYLYDILLFLRRIFAEAGGLRLNLGEIAAMEDNSGFLCHAHGEAPARWVVNHHFPLGSVERRELDQVWKTFLGGPREPQNLTDWAEVAKHRFRHVLTIFRALQTEEGVRIAREHSPGIYRLFDLIEDLELRGGGAISDIRLIDERRAQLVSLGITDRGPTYHATIPMGRP